MSAPLRRHQHRRALRIVGALLLLIGTSLGVATLRPGFRRARHSGETDGGVVGQTAPTMRVPEERGMSPQEQRDPGNSPGRRSDTLSWQDHQRVADSYLARLRSESETAQSKRLVRQGLAELEPASWTLTFLLKAHSQEEDRETRLHIESVVSQVDVSAIVGQAKAAAADSPNEEIFASLVVALGRVNTSEGKRALLDLAAAEVVARSPVRVKAVGASLVEAVAPEDGPLLLSLVETELNEDQYKIVTFMADKYPSSAMLQVLERIRARANQADTRVLAEKRSDAMRVRLKAARSAP